MMSHLLVFQQFLMHVPVLNLWVLQNKLHEVKI